MKSRAREALPAATMAGFTLIELMVALVVASFVVLAANAAVSFASDAAVRRSAAATPTLGAHMVRATLEGWMRAASLHAGPFAGVDRRMGELELDELQLGVADGGPLYPGPARVRLWTARGRGMEFEGVLAEIGAVHNGTVVRAETLVVAPRARGLALRYRVHLDGRDYWVDAWESDAQLPDAIEIRFLASPGPGTADSPLLHLPLVVPMGWTNR